MSPCVCLHLTTSPPLNPPPLHCHCQHTNHPPSFSGKVLHDLDAALQQLSLLRRLHIDFRSGLTLEHIEAISTACASRLQHLSLNMWAPGIGSKALVAVGQLSVLTSLQLLNLRAAVLSGPPGIIALREMPSLQLLCVQVREGCGMKEAPACWNS